MLESVAIDFGTSRTKLAYWNAATKRPELMRLGYHGQPYIPSLFYLSRQSDKILCGNDAEDMQADDPSGVIEVLKRRLRDSFIWANRCKTSPPELLTLLFSILRQRAGQEIAACEGQSPRQVSLTVPALYGPTDKEILSLAAMRAGFEEVSFVEEPVAAARAWLAETGGFAGEVIVLDCGGGTIDWAYLRRKKNSFYIVPECPPSGDDKVGGHDIDTELLMLIKAALEGEADAEIESRRSYYLQEARTLKERYCQGLPVRPLKIGSQCVTLDEKEIQAVFEKRFIHQACESLQGYLAKVRQTASGELPTVLLVGGSSRLKGLAEALESRCGCKTARWENSQFATVMGAVEAPLTTHLPERAFNTLTGHQHFVLSVSFSPDGRLLASGSYDESIRVWEVHSARELFVLPHKKGARAVAFSPDGQTLASGGYDETIRLWDVASGKELCCLAGHRDSVLSVIFSPNGLRLASGSFDGSVKLWEASNGREAQTLEEGSGSVYSVAFSADGHQLGYASGELVKLWDVARSREIFTLRGHTERVNAIAFSPDGRMLASAGNDGVIRLWDVSSGQNLSALIEGDDGKRVLKGEIRALVFSPDSTLLAAGGADQTIRLWDVNNKRTLRTLTGHKREIFSIAFSSDGDMLASGSGDCNIILWQ